MKILIFLNCCFTLAVTNNDCGKFRSMLPTIKVVLHLCIFQILADIPSFFGDRIVGGSVAPNMIPWQIAVLDDNAIQFCGGTILDAFTVLSAASCNISISHSIRAGSLIRNAGGQVCRALFCNETHLYFYLLPKKSNYRS